MERQPLPSATTPEAAKAPPTKERGGFFEKWRKKVEQAPLSTPEATPDVKKKSPKGLREAAPTPEAVQPEQRSFGKHILRLLRGPKVATPEATAAQPAALPEATPLVPTPEQTPQYQNASRVRRFARAVLANVLGTANNEPVIAAAQSPEAKPLATAPLLTAANTLQQAVTTLGSQMNQARHLGVAPNPNRPAAAVGSVVTGPNTIATAPNVSGSYAQPNMLPPTPQAPLTERLDYRLRQLEASAESNTATVLAANSLGVLAVLLVGVEYIGRKRAARKIRQELRQESAQQEKKLEKQQEAFALLRQEPVATMNRNQRQEYYERLGTFTKQQAEQTREATRELREVTVAYKEAVVPEQTPPAPVRAAHRETVPDRVEWRPRQPERAPVVTPEVTPKPVVRIERADRIERSPSRVSNAGTGFFGGGASSSGTATSGSQPQHAQLDPNSKEARQLEALRKLQQAKLQSNSWLYGAALILAMVGLVIVTIILG
jgi:cell division protein ZapA (FtsZ GTPase activity inhibitor)